MTPDADPPPGGPITDIVVTLNWPGSSVTVPVASFEEAKALAEEHFARRDAGQIPNPFVNTGNADRCL